MSCFHYNFQSLVCAFSNYSLLLISGVFLWVPSNSVLLVDIITRLDANDSYLHMYPLFWTNFWYLPAFYFLMTTHFKKPYQTTVTFFLLYILYVTELKDFNILNYTYNTYELVQFNNLLTNNLNKYHPFLFFLSTHVCFTLIYSLLTLVWSAAPFNGVYNLRRVARSNEYLNPLILVALTLGGVWAFQEASWGGFWNWDSSETFGLLFLITSLYLLHGTLKPSLSSQLITNLGLVFGALILMYCFIQLNFDLISHNFGVKFLHLFSNSFFYKEVILFNITACYGLWLLSWRDRHQLLHLSTLDKPSLTITTTSQFIFWWQLLVLIGVFILYGSLSQLISYTAFSLFQVNWFNFSGSFNITVILFYLYVIYWLVLPKTMNSITYVAVVSMSSNILFYLPSMVLMRLRAYDVIHFLVIWTTTLNILAYKTNFLFWSLEACNKIWLLHQTTFIVTNISITCDSLFIDNYAQLNSLVSEVSWWISNFSANSPNINSFFLLLHSGMCTSVYQLTIGTILSTITIITPYVANLLTCTVLMVVLVRGWCLRPFYRL